jgi:hypothetical protein
VPAATTAAPAAAAVPTRRQVQPRRLAAGRLKPAGHYTQPHVALLPVGWDFTDVLNPDFWTTHAATLQSIGRITDGLSEGVGSVFEVIPEDMAFYGKVIVKGLRRNAQGQADGVYVVPLGVPIDLNTGLAWAGRPKPPEVEIKAA